MALGLYLYLHVNDLARGGVDFYVQHPELIFRVFPVQVRIDYDQAAVLFRRQIQNGLKKCLQDVQARRLTEKQLENQVVFG
jgi:hypothetical protein